MRGKSEQWHDEMREHYGVIKVIPIDMEKMNADLDKNVKEAITNGKLKIATGKDEEGNPIYMTGADLEGVIFKDKGTFGLAFVKGTQIPIDKEAIIYNGDNGEWTLEAFKEKKTETGTSIGMFPVATTKMPINEIIEEYGMEEIDLPTFMDSRFAYNDRIVSNMSGALSYLKEQKVIE